MIPGYAGWQVLARRLADDLRTGGDLRSPQWHRAVAEVPRHLLVPAAYEQDGTGRWVRFNTAAALDRVYSRETLVTALATVDGRQHPVSSSTKPDLMVRMLEILDVQDGHRVLEIGTGTGYNAALLAHRLGDALVYSVDVDDDLVAVARQRLAAAAFHPTLVTADGARGLAEYAPFDRIVATCSVPSVPWEWADQLADGGTILVDFKLAVSAGNLVHLRRTGDLLEGHFTSRWAAFMAMRSISSPDGPVPRVPRASGGRARTTTSPATPWADEPQSWFLAQTRLPQGTTFGYELDPDTRQPIAATLSGPDGSWAFVSMSGGNVVEAGPTPLWSHVEWGHDHWHAAGRPTWQRLGLTITPDGTHQLWLDDPKGEYTWAIPSATRNPARSRHS